MKAGAHMSMGKTSDGSIFVLTSTDPAVQTRLASLYTKCAMMHGQATAN
jgi:hypothetical protein